MQTIFGKICSGVGSDWFSSCIIWSIKLSIIIIDTVFFFSSSFSCQNKSQCIVHLNSFFLSFWFCWKINFHCFWFTERRGQYEKCKEQERQINHGCHINFCRCFFGAFLIMFTMTATITGVYFCHLFLFCCTTVF